MPEARWVTTQVTCQLHSVLGSTKAIAERAALLRSGGGPEDWEEELAAPRSGLYSVIPISMLLYLCVLLGYSHVDRTCQYAPHALFCVACSCPALNG